MKSNFRMSKYIEFLPLLFVLELHMMTRHCNCWPVYCWQNSWSPSFKSDPKVEQLSNTKVRVSWDGIVDKIECADSFIVKYWRKSNPIDLYGNPSTYKMTIPVPTDVSYEDIEVAPDVNYLFQVIALSDISIEYKGPILGVDYNKAEPIEFKTSSSTCNCNPVGSINQQCSKYTGNCVCKYGFTGQKCDECMGNMWGDPKIGDCQLCNCSEYSSESLQCDRKTGKCECLNAVGKQCDQCKEKFWGNPNASGGCKPCNCFSECGSNFRCDSITGQCDCLGGKL